MRSLRKDSLFLDILFLVLVFAIFRVVSLRYSSRALAQEMAYRQTAVDSIGDVVDSFILAETDKIRFLTPLLAASNDVSANLEPLLGGVKSLRAVYNVDRQFRVHRILFMEHPNRGYLENVNLTPRLIVGDMEFALREQTTVITRLHSSIATGLYSFSFLFPHENGILVAEVDLENILDVVRRTGLLKTYKDSTVLLINPLNGQVHYSSDVAVFPFMQFSPPAPDFAVVGGKPYYYAMRQMRVLDLVLVALSPRQSVEALVGMMRQYLNLILACLCALALARWFFLRQSILRPLARFLERIRSGDSSPPSPHRYREWSQLENTYVDARRRIESSAAALQSARDFLHLVIDAVPASVVVLDRSGNVVHWNQAARRMAHSANGAPPPPGNAASLFPFLENLGTDFSSILSKAKRFSSRGLLVRSNPSSSSYYDVIFSPFSSGSFSGGVLVVLDVSREMRKDLQLQQAQKMDMIGNLAGGLAHDLNNLLGGISGSAEMMGLLAQDPVFDSKQFDHYLHLVSQSVSRAAEMVRQLLTLSRKQEVDLRPANLGDVVANVVRIAERTLLKSVSIDVHGPDSPPMVLGDPARLEQVFLNLVLNAAHAMTTMRPTGADQGGTVCIRIAPVQPGPQLRAKFAAAGDRPCWLVAVSDSGVGMSPDVLRKIFDPFFTTRAKGTGLGLAMVYNILQYHGGFVDVYSEEGLGSTFNVYLPALDAPGLLPDAPANPAHPIVRGQGLVLVADDDDVMRSTAADFLAACGYSVLAAADGRECVEIYRQNASSVSVVLLDMVMPVLSGHDAYLCLRQLDPNVKVLLCSGFKQDQRVLDILKLGAAGFVQKPYALHELSSAIHRAIAATPAPQGSTP